MLFGLVLPGAVLCFGNPQWHKQLYLWQTWLMPSRQWPWGAYTGTWTVWAQDGRKVFEWEYVDGQPKGRLLWFHPDGTMQGECWAEDGHDHGRWTVWYLGGAIVREQGEKQRGEKHGRWRYFHPHGTLAGEGYYDRGRPVGTWLAFAADGETVAQGEYRAGTPWHGAFAIDHAQMWDQPVTLGPVMHVDAAAVSSPPSASSPPPP